MKVVVNNHPHHSMKKAIKRGEKKSSKRMDHKKNWDLEIPQPNHLVSVSIYIVVWGEEDKKEGRQRGHR